MANGNGSVCVVIMAINVKIINNNGNGINGSMAYQWRNENNVIIYQ